MFRLEVDASIFLKRYYEKRLDSSNEFVYIFRLEVDLVDKSVDEAKVSSGQENYGGTERLMLDGCLWMPCYWSSLKRVHLGVSFLSVLQMDLHYCMITMDVQRTRCPCSKASHTSCMKSNLSGVIKGKKWVPERESTLIIHQDIPTVYGCCRVIWGDIWGTAKEPSEGYPASTFVIHIIPIASLRKQCVHRASSPSCILADPENVEQAENSDDQTRPVATQLMMVCAMEAKKRKQA